MLETEMISIDDDTFPEDLIAIATCKVHVPVKALEHIGHKMSFFLDTISREFGVTAKLVEETGKSFLLGQAECVELINAFQNQMTSLLSSPNMNDLNKYFPQTVRRVDVTAVKNLLLANNQRILIHVEQDSSVRSRIIETHQQAILEARSDNGEDVLEAFINQIERIVRAPVAFQDELNERAQKKLVHVFVDVSNIEINCKHGQSKILDIEKLTNVVVNMRGCKQKLAVGSYDARHSSGDESSNSRWQKHGYDVRMLQRLSNGKEQAVDDVLHAAIQELTFKVFPIPRTLIILTGDGNNNDNRTNFPEVMEGALRNGWKVEIWSWKKSTSAIYKNFQECYSSHFSLSFLDDYCHHILQDRFKTPQQQQQQQQQPQQQRQISPNGAMANKQRRLV